MVNMTASAGNFVSHFKTESRLAESAWQSQPSRKGKVRRARLGVKTFNEFTVPVLPSGMLKLIKKQKLVRERWSILVLTDELITNHSR